MVVTGRSKSLVTAATSAKPDTVAGTIFITGIHNGHSATATIKEDSNSGTTVAVVKSGSTFTPPTPIKLDKGKKIYSDVQNVTLTYLDSTVNLGGTFTGPNGYPWDQTNDTFAGPFAYSY